MMLWWLACGPEVDTRPRFCVRAECNLRYGLLDGCPDSETSACRMDDPWMAICPATPGGCAPVEAWLRETGWFDSLDPAELFLSVKECQATVAGVRDQWFTVTWLDDEFVPPDPRDIEYRYWEVWFDRKTGSIRGMRHSYNGHGSSGWCCGTGEAGSKVWGEYVDPHDEGNCHGIRPGWPGW